MSDPVTLRAFRSWYEAQDPRTQEDVRTVVELLAARGTALGFPYSSAVEGTRHPLRELRVQSGGKPVRVFYAFDPTRDAVLILGAFKRDARFYKRYLPRVERLWERYLSGAEDGEEDEGADE
jgi:hypothetical protein